MGIDCKNKGAMDEKAQDGNAALNDSGESAAPSLTPSHLSLLLSRRDMLAHALRGASSLAALTLLPIRSEAADGIRPGPRVGGQTRRLLAGSTDVLQLPFWGDGANWDRPEYYETIQAGRRHFPKTIQSADVDGDGQDELFARGPDGMLFLRFDPDTGQWMNLPGLQAPNWSDAEGWNVPWFYQTIQTADIDGDGRAELLARDPNGIQVWEYTNDDWAQFPADPNNTPCKGPEWDAWWYSETIQCADIDGDGRAELLARAPDGIQVWKYTDSGWTPLPPGPPWGDGFGFRDPSYYQTIQCADIDGDGRKELLARNEFGIDAWKYTDSGWTQLQYGPNPPPWSNVAGWTNPWYYETIQCADIDGDGRAELLARDSLGIEAWKYTDIGWTSLPNGPSWGDANKWDQEQYYRTIQCADIDGDGREELIARSRDGIEVWQYTGTGTNGQWTRRLAGPAWTDIKGWNASQFYRTIQTARVKGSEINNPNNPPNRHGDKPVAALIGRNPLAIETWRYGVDNGVQQWSRTSAPFPAFTGDQLTYYHYITNKLNILGTGSFGIRARYNDETAPLQTWIDNLTGSGPRPVAPPTGVSANDPDWVAVKEQILNELTCVRNVHNWYGNLTNGLITDIYLGNDLIVQTVGDYMNLPSDDDTTVFLNILSLLFNGAWAVLGFPELEAGNASAVAGILATAFSAASEFLPGGTSIQAKYADLQTALANNFVAALRANGENQLTITGGLVGRNYLAGDWGLLSAIGQQIESTLWNWPSTTSDLILAAQREYALYVWQALIQTKWVIGYDFRNGPYSGPDYPDRFIYRASSDFADQFWININNTITPSYPAVPSLVALFDPVADNHIFPLRAPLADVFEGRNGWPKLRRINFTEDYLVTPTPPQRPSFGAKLEISDMALSRDAATGEIVAIFRLTNYGLSGASNVTLTSAQLKNRKATGGVPSRHIRLAAGRSRPLQVRFPSNTGAAGERVLLRLSGRYHNGSFGGSFRVTLP